MKNLLVLLSATILFSSVANGTEDKLTIGFFSSRDVREIIGDYPAHGSAEEAHDYQVLLDYQETRTEQDCLEAAEEKTPTLKSMFMAEGLLTQKEVRRLAPRFWKAYIVVGLNSTIAKKTFDRDRPYVANSNIIPCIPFAKSKAYPSGHTIIARVFALKLSQIYPERAAAFMQRADEVALNRVIGGVHHPSDIEAGKVLGDAIFNQLLNNNPE